MNKRTFISLFAGCGGLSLGLMSAGWEGLFAIEKNPWAFETLSRNLIARRGRGPVTGFNWPAWLPVAPHNMESFPDDYKQEIAGLKGTVSLVVGGPPCQGFSTAGRRKQADPRNKMYLHYLKVVAMVQPSFILLENVRGISVDFSEKKRGKSEKRGLGRPPKSYAQRIQDALDELGYEVKPQLVKAVDFGVPQVRPRYIFIGVRRDLIQGDSVFAPFDFLERTRTEFLQRKGLGLESLPVGAKDALSDLETYGRRRIACTDSPGFEQVQYSGPRTDYQKLLHGDLNGAPLNSLRLVKHREKTIKRFSKMLKVCRPGTVLSLREKKQVGESKKFSRVVLHPDRPSPTLTTLPDDIVHYSEPRILTARESARLQSFPDWFEFRGSYTTGCTRRIYECPRYTQVGNAVPPFLAEALGLLLAKLSKVYQGK